MEKADCEKLINRAVKELIESRLAWSGSDKGTPSRDEGNVRGAFVSACREACCTVDEWNSMSEHEQDRRFDHRHSKLDDAAAEADRKREAVKVMLDLWIPNRR